MHLCFLLALTVGLPADTSNTTYAKTGAGARQMEGTWELVTLEGNPSHLAILTMQDLAEARLVVRGRTWQWKLGKTALKMTSRPEVGAGPQVLDLTIASGPDRGHTFRGLYVLQGNTLKICTHRRPGKDRPAGIETRPDGEYVIVIWKRQVRAAPAGKHPSPYNVLLAEAEEPAPGTPPCRK
jgi:uncharacterized protein (TIGR03067 family)